MFNMIAKPPNVKHQVNVPGYRNELNLGKSTSSLYITHSTASSSTHIHSTMLTSCMPCFPESSLFRYHFLKIEGPSTMSLHLLFENPLMPRKQQRLNVSKRRRTPRNLVEVARSRKSEKGFLTQGSKHNGSGYIEKNMMQRVRNLDRKTSLQPGDQLGQENQHGRLWPQILRYQVKKMERMRKTKRKTQTWTGHSVSVSHLEVGC
jgi:hypothetical protein